MGTAGVGDAPASAQSEAPVGVRYREALCLAVIEVLGELQVGTAFGASRGGVLADSRHTGVDGADVVVVALGVDTAARGAVRSGADAAAPVGCAGSNALGHTAFPACRAADFALVAAPVVADRVLALAQPIHAHGVASAKATRAAAPVVAALFPSAARFAAGSSDASASGRTLAATATAGVGAALQ